LPLPLTLGLRLSLPPLPRWAYDNPEGLPPERVFIELCRAAVRFPSFDPLFLDLFPDSFNTFLDEGGRESSFSLVGDPVLAGEARLLVPRPVDDAGECISLLAMDISSSIDDVKLDPVGI